MKLSTILTLTFCQFLIGTTNTMSLESTDRSIKEECTDKISHVQIVETGNQLIVAWDPPTCDLGVEVLEVKYNVTYSPAGETVSIETRETFYNFDYTTKSCFDFELQITSFLNGFITSKYFTTYRPRSSQVNHVQILEMMTQLVVVWNPPDCDIGDAQVKYIVAYTIANETQTIETEETFHYFDYVANICSDVEITISAVLDDETGLPYDTIYKTRLGEVANLYAEHTHNNTVHVKWDAPAEGSDCDLDYLITLDSSNGSISIIMHNLTESYIWNVYMQPCENATLTITPKHGKILGSTLNRTVQGEIGPVRNIVIENAFDDDEIYVDYDEPENTDLCNLRYSVHYGPADCFQREISIKAFNIFGNSSHITSTTVDRDIQIPPVDNLTATRTVPERILVTWDPVLTEYNCNIAYRISREFDNGQTSNHTITGKSFWIDYCASVAIRVVPVVDNIPGEIIRSVTVPAAPADSCDLSQLEPTEWPTEEPWY